MAPDLEPYIFHHEHDKTTIYSVHFNRINQTLAMLLTSDRRQIVIPAELRVSDERCWKSVELGLSLPMFFCTIAVNTEYGMQQRVIITTLIGQLNPAQLISSAKATVVSIDIFSPGWLNKSDRWKMDSLHSVEEASSPDGTSWLLIYNLESGERYVEVTTGTLFVDYTNIRTILKCPVHTSNEYFNADNKSGPERH